jgi:hypothetical protein
MRAAATADGAAAGIAAFAAEYHAVVVHAIPRPRLREALRQCGVELAEVQPER